MFDERNIMATVNGAVRTQRHAASNRVRAVRPASRRHRKPAKLAQMRENASEYFEQGRDQVYRVERTLEHFIRTQPVKSVVIGATILMLAGVGLALGTFWMRR
jgi:ElaB/YqjD/DUF883 family membrane-anchored ribosome-binding protein